MRSLSILLVTKKALAILKACLIIIMIINMIIIILPCALHFIIKIDPHHIRIIIQDRSPISIKRDHILWKVIAIVQGSIVQL